jgi:hypothetical protein
MLEDEIFRELVQRRFVVVGDFGKTPIVFVEAGQPREGVPQPVSDPGAFPIIPLEPM